MMGYTHAAIGCVLALGVNHLFPSVLGRSPEILGMAVLGSLAPDLDEPQSLLGKKLAVIAYPLKLLLGHRGFTHSLAALVLATAVLAGLFSAGYGPRPAYGLAFLLGYAGHLGADWMTSAGAPLLWPNPTRHASPLPMRTGGVMEHAVMTLVVAAGVWLASRG
jgi:inner membrane protein